jgi:hypothetical protein
MYQNIDIKATKIVSRNKLRLGLILRVLTSPPASHHDKMAVVGLQFVATLQPGILP